MLPRKKWYTWTVLLRLVFLDKEYLSEVFQTLLAVPHFSKVAGKKVAVAQRSSVKKLLLKISQNPQENTCTRGSFLAKLQVEACNFIKKETLAQVFFCEFCEIFKKTFFYGTPPVAASEKLKGQAYVRKCSVKKVFLQISQNSRESTCARVSFLQT